MGLHNQVLVWGSVYALRGCASPPWGEFPRAIPTKWDRFSGALNRIIIIEYNYADFLLPTGAGF